MDDRSKCCRFRRWPSPSILAMRLQCMLSVCRSELRDTSSKLRGKGARHQPASFTAGPPDPAPPRPRPPLAPRARLPAPPAARHQPRLPLRHSPHLFTPLSMRQSSPGTGRSPAIPLSPLPAPTAAALQTSLLSTPTRPALRLGHNTLTTAPPQSGAAPPFPRQRMRTAAGEAAMKARPLPCPSDACGARPAPALPRLAKGLGL